MQSYISSLFSDVDQNGNSTVEGEVLFPNKGDEFHLQEQCLFLVKNTDGVNRGVIVLLHYLFIFEVTKHIFSFAVSTVITRAGDTAG